MTFFLSLKNGKKRDWVIAAALAFVLSLSFCLFDDGGFSSAAQPAYWQLAVCGAWFFCAVGLIFSLEQFWVPLAVAVCGAAGCFAAAPEFRMLLLFVFLPAALLCWLFCFFSPFGTKGRQSLPLWAGVSFLFLVADVYLAVRVAGLPSVWEFFLPRQNNQLWGFFVLLAMFLFSVLLFFVFLPKTNPVEDGKGKHANKKKNGKARAGKNTADRGFPVKLLFLPLLFFYVCVLLCAVVLWDRGENLIAYSLQNALSALFVTLAMCAK